MSKEELEKENAELKESNEHKLKVCKELAHQANVLQEQLTEARELLRFWVNDFYDGFNNSIRYEERHKVLVETEQFLKEIEK